MEANNENKNIETKAINFDWKKLMSVKFVEDNIMFILFLSLLTIIYIGNVHRHDRLLKQIAKTEKSIERLEFEYKSKKSELIFRSKASELVKAVAPLGLKELLEAPVVLVDSITVEN